MALYDRYGRKHDYLRISITDRCNLRCLYCMGEEGVPLLTHDDILSYEDFLKVIKTGADLGIKKIRITGGEPLVRRGVVDFVKKVAQVPGIEDISMTTNGVLLEKFAAGLKEAGLNRVNISLDSLQAEKYRQITRCGSLEEVLAGLEAALKHDLHPVKLNVVLMKGYNDNEIIDFLELARTKPLHVRFIEYMPIGEHDTDYKKHYLPLEVVAEEAKKAGFNLTPTRLKEGAGPAEAFNIPGGKGTIGLIHPISKHFCDTCNRLRLTADGKLKACLYWQEETSVRSALGDKEALKKLFQETLNKKRVKHSMGCAENCNPVNPCLMRAMSKTGG